MEAVHSRTRELSREESLQYLENKSYVGRVAFIAGGRPTILPVNYLAEAGSIVFCTAAGGTLSALGGGAPVAFEVDSNRPLFHTGWSVLVHGTARAVTEPEEVVRLQRGPLRSWAVAAPAHWIRISIEQISGRRLAEA